MRSSTPKRIRWKVEEEYKSASRLKQLILRHLYSVDGITEEEFVEVQSLIRNTPESANICVCGFGKKTIGDTDGCRDCNNFRLLRTVPLRISVPATAA